uniref:Uncharacterized protein n=1 Tax=Timema cristinae TaxID=61476 RepID=A0A7R9HCA9_TIMCR|nr:unnamed protein product [Timema cristinae]
MCCSIVESSCGVLMVHWGLELSKEVTKISGPKLVDFKRVLKEDPIIASKINALKLEVEVFSRSFPLPGLPLL